MKKDEISLRPTERWAHFRFSVIGPLLAAPPSRGQLQAQLQELAAKKWRHPITGAWVLFGGSTIERWYYQALGSRVGPVEALKRKIRSDHGLHPSLSPRLIELLTEQHRQHPGWSYQLHADNLAVLAEQPPLAGPMPSYASVWRYMKSHGLLKRARRGPAHRAGAQAAEHRYLAREVRSYESEYVNGLWHLDFHHGSLRVLQADGQWVYPILLGILDDHSRLCCHLQWYLAEGARELCHGLCQAFQKRDLPRSLLYDNGSAMIASETEQGLTRLGVLFENTLPYSPYQNGKQEAFWGQVEGRLLPMLEGVGALTVPTSTCLSCWTGAAPSSCRGGRSPHLPNASSSSMRLRGARARTEQAMTGYDIILLAVAILLAALLAVRRWKQGPRRQDEPPWTGHGIDAKAIAKRIDPVRHDYCFVARYRSHQTGERRLRVASARREVTRLRFFHRHAVRRQPCPAIFVNDRGPEES